MISLFLKNYRTEEVEELRRLFQLMEIHLRCDHKHVIDCKHCPNRNVCGDIQRAQKYLANYSAKE